MHKNHIYQNKYEDGNSSIHNRDGEEGNKLMRKKISPSALSIILVLLTSMLNDDLNSHNIFIDPESSSFGSHNL